MEFSGRTALNTRSLQRFMRLCSGNTPKSQSRLNTPHSIIPSTICTQATSGTCVLRASTLKEVAARLPSAGYATTWNTPTSTYAMGYAATEILPQPPCTVYRGGENQDRHSTKPQHPENAAQLACGCIREEKES